jgi:hypothetical protein
VYTSGSVMGEERLVPTGDVDKMDEEMLPVSETEEDPKFVGPWMGLGDHIARDMLMGV